MIFPLHFNVGVVVKGEYMIKYTWFVFMLAAMLGFSFSAEKGIVYVDIPSALAGSENGNKSDNGKSDNGHKNNGKSDDEKKVTVCHFPPGNPKNASTMRVSESALHAHLAHGDTRGVCGPCACPTNGGVETPECYCANGMPGVVPGVNSTTHPNNVRQIFGN
ncbi:hypothetical protein AL013_11735 [Mariprofundus ferrooxydans]|uniref:Uncharacterized protein n=2 Tax=Mariprofundus ferrooxydans TaxID=314344 RepID=Q0EZH7_9PROT|nr:hypothetical protein SPV1_14124 [Mariprofundus ferrooxydans PV-1]KON46719.1 hypothetical protein AL013_11735 [Mariprofundus ferrooxydans]